MKIREKEHSEKVESNSEHLSYSVCECGETNMLNSQTNNKRKLEYRRNSGQTCSLRNIVICLVVLTIFLSDIAGAMPRTMLCDRRLRCLNGGTLQVPDTSFGWCVCNCRQGYAGLRCQFNRNRNRRIRRLNRLKRLVKLRNNFEHLLKRRKANR